MRRGLRFHTDPRTTLLPATARRMLLALATTTAIFATASANASVSPPQYYAGISVLPDAYPENDTPLRAGYSLFGDMPTISRNPVDVSLSHISFLRSETTGVAYAGPENGGTVRAIVTTGDEFVGASAAVGYVFQLRPKAGVVVPDVVPLHVFANGSTGTDNYGGARIRLTLNWFDSLTTTDSIVLETTTASAPGSVTHEIGDGNIHLDDDINVALNRDFAVALFAGASAGISVVDGNPYLNEYGTGSAYLDPLFTLPEAYRDLVDIVGVPAGATLPPTDPSAVPEPASWMMMIAGFGVVGRAMRRRHRSVFRSANG